MTCHVIVVNGAPRAGKDQLIHFMTDILERAGIRQFQFSSIDPVKDMLQAAGICTKAKTPEDRKLLAGIACLLEEHSQFRSRFCVAAVQECQAVSRDTAVFLHIREPEIIALVRDLLQAQDTPPQFHAVQVVSPRALTAHSNSQDAGTGRMAYDLLVDNSGSLGQLYDAAQAALETLGVLP